MPDKVGTELDAVQVVRLALVVEPHLLQLLPILSWPKKMLARMRIDKRNVPMTLSM